MNIPATWLGRACLGLFLLTAPALVAEEGRQWFEGWSSSLSPGGYWIDIEASADGSTLAASSSADNDPDLVVSSDFGETWQSVRLPASTNLEDTLSPKVSSIALSADGEAILAARFAEGAWFSPNRGRHWVKSLNDYFPTIRHARGAGTFHALGSAGLLVGDGMPGNWTTNVLPHPSYAFGVSSNGQVLLIAGGYPLDISLSEDGGTTWRGIHLRNAGHSADIAVSGDGSTMVVIAGAIQNQHFTSFAAFISRDRGKTWEEPAMPHTRLGPPALSHDGSQILIGSASDTSMYGGTRPAIFSGDGGRDWVLLENIVAPNVTMSSDGLRMAAAPRWGALLTSGRIYHPFGFVTNIAGDIELNADREIKLSVQASGGKLRYQWRKDGSDLEETPHRTGVRSSELVLKPASELDLGRYSVLISNSVGSAEVAAGTLNLSFALPAIHGIEQRGGPVLRDGMPVSFSVSATGGLLSYQWFRDGVPIQEEAGYSGFTGPRLQLPSAAIHYAGVYSVVVTNPIGRAEKIVGRLEETAPRLLSVELRGGPAVPIGETFKFAVSAEGGDVRFHLFHNDRPFPASIAPSQSGTQEVLVTNFSMALAGEYFIIASNRLGTAKSSTYSVRLADWTKLNFDGSSWHSAGISSDGSRLMAASANRLVLSEDGGLSWIHSTPTSGSIGRAALAGNGGALVLAVTSAFSMDLRTGKAWSPSVVLRSYSGESPPFSSEGGFANSLALSSDGQVIFSGESWRTFGMYPASLPHLLASRDGGLTWFESEMTDSWYFDRFQSLSCSRDGAVAAAVRTDARFYISLDRGLTWEIRQTPALGEGAAAAINEDASLVFLAGASGIHFSRDRGLSWEATSAPGIPFNKLAASADGNRLYAASASGEIYQSRDGGKSWFLSGAPSARWQALACSADGDRLIAASDAGVFLNPAPSPTRVESKGARVSLDGPFVEMVWSGEPHQTYLLFKKEQLEAANWTHQGAAVCDAAGKFKIRVPPTGRAAFWRATLLGQ